MKVVDDHTFVYLMLEDFNGSRSNYFYKEILDGLIGCIERFKDVTPENKDIVREKFLEALNFLPS